MTYKDYFKPETTRGTCTLDAMYYFGLLPPDKRSILEIADDVEMNEIEDITLHYVTLSKGNTPLDDLTARFILINGLPLYWMLGKMSSTFGVTPRVITNYTTANKPSIAAFLEGDNSIKTQAKGLVAQSMTINFEIDMPGVLCQISDMGMSHGISTAVPTVTYPDGISTPYNQITHFKLATVAFAIKAFNMNFNNKLTPLIGNDGYYQEISHNSPIKHIVTVMFKDGVDVTDIKAYQRAGTTITLELKVSKSAGASTYYWTHSVDVKCIGVGWVRVIGKPDQLVGIFWATGACTDTFADGLTTDALYGLSA